jgi:Na+/proline symporter
MWRGLLLAAFAAAYMSTIATHLNWGTSYLINDFYRRFIRPSAEEKHYVRVSRATTGLLALISILVTLNMHRITGAWELLLGLGAGTGLVYLLRWFWWRINAWSEIAAMTTALVVTVGVKLARPFSEDDPLLYAKSMLVTVTVTTVAWMLVTWLTPPEPEAKLLEFYRRVRPGGPGWTALARRFADPPPGALTVHLLGWALGCVLIYGVLFGIGAVIFGRWRPALLSLGIGLLAGGGILKLLTHGWGSEGGSCAR